MYNIIINLILCSLLFPQSSYNLYSPEINSFYPDSNLWQDNSVFINRNYGVNPITIGVATFDGLNSNGRAYDMTFTGTDSENADTLSSQLIDLSDADTAYFMFYYQSCKASPHRASQKV